VDGGPGEDKVPVRPRGPARPEVPPLGPSGPSLRGAGDLWGLFVLGGRDEGGEEVHKCGQVLLPSSPPLLSCMAWRMAE
jgi:hypothetical protein